MSMKPLSSDQSATSRRKMTQVISVEAVHDNTSQQLISITTDKLKLALIEHLDCVAKHNAWHMPLSLFVGVVVVFCSSNFKEALGLSADTWGAIFALFGAGCLLWFFVCLAKIRKSKSLDDLIEIIKNK
ncbi:hypothetical protein ACTJK9_22730 [Pseudomonas sp. 22082]|uniref:hypothetical protein n=1 Tax=Pseudomonas sp. 22082 TaxID=3453868 RepID=UPI003F85CB3C